MEIVLKKTLERDIANTLQGTLKRRIEKTRQPERAAEEQSRELKVAGNHRITITISAE